MFPDTRVVRLRSPYYSLGLASGCYGWLNTSIKAAGFSIINTVAFGPQGMGSLPMRQLSSFPSLLRTRHEYDRDPQDVSGLQEDAEQGDLL